MRDVLICPYFIPASEHIIEGRFLLDVKFDMLGHQAFLIFNFLHSHLNFFGFSKFTHNRKSIYYGHNINQ